jgi:predicted nucleotidyltransferase
LTLPRIEPGLIHVLTDLERGLRELRIPFAVVGALVPELLLDARPLRMTNDADVTVIVRTLADFETLKDRFADFDFTRTRVPHRMQHRSGGLADLIPFSESIAPDGRLQLEEGIVFNMAGFGQVVPHAIFTKIDGGPTLPVAPLPLYALLKLVAFSDRKEAKDLAGVFHCLQHYLKDDERRYGVEQQGEGVPYEYTCAYLLGDDGRRFLDEPLGRAVTGVLDRFTNPDVAEIGIVARESGRIPIEDEDRSDIFEHFRWYRLGAGL